MSQISQIAVRSYRTTDRDWAELAEQDLLDEEVIIVDGLLIDGRTFHPRRPVWGQMCKRLRAAGIPVPELPPE